MIFLQASKAYGRKAPNILSSKKQTERYVPGPKIRGKKTKGAPVNVAKMLKARAAAGNTAT